MSSITVRNVPAEVHRALRARAVAHGHSTEAEVRDILEQAARPESRVKLGSLLTSIGREAGLTRADVEGFRKLRDLSPVQPVGFE